MNTCGVVRTYHKENCNSIYYCNCNETNGFQLKIEYFQNSGKIEVVYKLYWSNG